MEYDAYKQRIIRLNHKINTVLRFKWLILSCIVVIVSLTTYISITKGSISSVEFNPTYTYGDSIDISANVKMSNVIRYEYKALDATEWTTQKPSKVGKYETRIVSKGLFGNKISKAYEFEILKKPLVIDVNETTIKYGDKPTYTITGLSDNDSLTAISYDYTDASKKQTLINVELSSVIIENENSENVTECYSITSNASSGKEISFTPLEMILEPVVENKVYDGLSSSFENKYIIVENKQTGYDDVITVNTAIYKDGVKVENAIVAGTYEVKIEQTLVNGVNNENYNFTNLVKEFTISKKDITITTNDSSKIYDGTDLTCLDFSISSNSLASSDVIDVTEFAKVLNAGNTRNVLAFSIENNGVDVLDSYNITYEYGTLTVNKKPIEIITSSNSKVYDNTELIDTKYEASELVGSDYLSVISHSSLTNVGTVSNNLVLEAYTSDNTKSNNYELNYTYGTLEVTKASVKIKPNDIDSVVYNGEEYNDFADQSFTILEGQFYNNELTSVNLTFTSDLYSDVKNVGIYSVSINKVELDNYAITYETNTFEITKAPVTLQASDIEQTFNYENVIPSSTEFNILNETTLYNDDSSKIELQMHYELDDTKIDNIYHAGNYSVYIDDIVVSDDLIKNNYEFSYEVSSVKINAKDVTIKLKEQSHVYEKAVIDFTYLIDTEEEAIINNIKVNNIKSSKDNLFTTDDELKDSGIYYVIFEESEYSFIDSDTFKAIDFNISIESSTYTISKRPITIKVKTQDESIYNGTLVTFDSDQYEVVSEYKLCEGDALEVVVGDVDNKTIKNADTYNLIIESYTGNNLDNYDITKSDEYTTYLIKPYDVDIVVDDETIVYDGATHIANDKFNESQDSLTLFNDDLVTIEIETDTILDVNEYVKKATAIFTQGSDTDSVESNYNFKIQNGKFIVTKRSITIKLNDVTHYYYNPLEDSAYVSQTNYLTDDTTQAGVVGDDVFSITKSSYDSESAKTLSVNEYDLEIKEYDIKRDDVSVIDNYSIELVKGLLTITKRPVTICANSSTFEYDKQYHKFDETSTIYDYDNSIISSLPDSSTYTINYHFEKDDLSFGTKIINVGEYTLVVDGLNETLDNYDITLKNATYTINKRYVNVYIKDVNTIYDATYQSPLTTYEISYKTEKDIIDADITYVLNGTYSFKNCGTYKFEFTITALTNTSTNLELLDYVDSLDNYDITYEDSYFIINQREIYISLGTDTYIYDGNSKDYDKSIYTILDTNQTSLIDSGVMYDELKNLPYSVSYKYEGSIVTPGKALTYDVIVNTNSDDVVIVNSTDTVYDNYIIYPKTSGKLVINKRNLTIKINDLNVTFDGKDHIDEISYEVIKDEDNVKSGVINKTGYKNNVDNIEDEITFTSYNYDSFVNAATYNVILKEFNVSDNISLTFGNKEFTVTIAKRRVSIKPVTKDYIYDKTTHDLGHEWEYLSTFAYTEYELTLDKEELNEDNIILYRIDNDVEVYSTKDAGTYTIYLRCTNNNYDVTSETTTLTVSPMKVNVSIDGFTTRKTYTGKTISYDGDFKLLDVDNKEFSEYPFDKDKLEFESASYVLVGTTDALSEVKNAGTYSVINPVFRSFISDDYNYELHFVGTATLIIDKASITMSLANKDIIRDYDGTSAPINYTWSGEENSEISIVKDTFDVIGSYTLTYKYTLNTLDLDSAPILAGKYEIRVYTLDALKDNLGNDILSNYELKTEVSNYTINKIDLTIKTLDYEIFYDGSNHEYLDYTSNGLAFTDTIEVSTYTTVKNVGEYKNELTVLVKNGEIDATKSYNITYEYGTITVKKTALKFSSDGKTFTYESYKEYKNDTFNVSINDLDTITLTESKSTFTLGTKTFKVIRTDVSSLYKVGKILDEFSIDLITLYDEDVINNFDISYDFNSDIEVIPQSITISAINKTATYNGKNYDYTEAITIVKQYENSDLIKYTSVTIICDGTKQNVIHNVGEYSVVVALDGIKFFEAKDNIDVTDCYEFSTTDNISFAATIKQKEIKFITESNTFVWDGTDKTCEVYKITDMDDFTFEPYEGKFEVTNFAILNAYDNTIKLLNNSIENSASLNVILDSVDITKNYKITQTFGTLSFYTEYNVNYDKTTKYSGSNNAFNIDDVDIITSDNINTNYSITFDIDKLTCDGVETTNNDIVDAGKYVITPKESSIKLYINGIEITNDELVNKGITLNIDIKHVIEKLEILLKTEITVLEYNGSEQNLENNEIKYTLEQGSLVNGQYLEVKSSVSATLPGESNYKAFVNGDIKIYENISGNQIDVTKNYNILNYDSKYSYKSDYQASIQIKQFELEIDSQSINTTYDGNEHFVTINNFDELTNTLAQNGQKFEIIKVTNACYKLKAIKITDESGTDVTNYYDFDLTITINKCNLELNVTKNEYIYDNKEHGLSISNLDEVNNIVQSNNDSFEVITYINKGTYDSNLYKITRDENDVSENYKVYIYGNSKLIIKQSTELVLNDVSNSFIYNGKSRTISISNFEEIEGIVVANGHTISYNSQINVGSYTPFIVKNGSVDITDNYHFVDKEGNDVTLDINEYEFNNISVNESYFDFDSIEHTININETDFNKIKSIIEAHGNTIYYTKGIDATIYDAFIVLDADNNDVTYNYIFTDSDGYDLTFEINPINITLNVITNSYVYDGSNKQIIISNFDSIKDYLNSNFGYTISYVSESESSDYTPFIIKNGDIDVTSNFIFVNEYEEEVYLEIIQKQIVVKLSSNKTSFAYDGYSHSLYISNLDDIKNELPSGYTLTKVSMTNAGRVNPLTISYNGEDVTSEFEIVDESYNLLELQITERIVYLKVSKNTYTYDGVAHTISLKSNTIYNYLADNDNAKLRSITNVGSEVPYIITNVSGEDVTDNYIFIDQNNNYSYITIEECKTVVTFEKNTFVYDGIGHTISGLKLTLPSGFTYSLVSLTDVGSTLPFIIYKNGEDVTNNFEFVDQSGNEVKLIITYTD